MPVIPHAESRRTETPNARMTTLASPTQGGTALALWRVDMVAGQQGPRHSFDRELVWTVLAGAARVVLGAETLVVEPGDTVVMPADTPRQVFADRGTDFAAIVAAPGRAQAYVPDDGRDGERSVPPWVA